VDEASYLRSEQSDNGYMLRDVAFWERAWYKRASANGCIGDVEQDIVLLDVST
jgi:hypothetical protein